MTAPTATASDVELSNAIRALAMDAVEAAKSGHPGMPMGMAEISVALWNRHLRHNPANPHWPDRDRFVLSAGHGSMLIYSLLNLTGFARPTIEDIADALHVSARTMQRRLQEEGSSFQRVLEEARHQLARHYLNNSVLELNEAAYLLGYNDSNSFVRAFRSWEGIPPARWREEQRAKAVS